ncbi:MAG: DUF4386 domain-containing protein [Actinomycetes bacterium]
MCTSYTYSSTSQGVHRTPHHSEEVLMNATRNNARIAAIFYFITWVTSILGLAMYGPILNHAVYSFGSISKGHIISGAFLEILAALANIGTGLALYPIVKRQSESFALGYVVLRTLEAGIMMVGTLPLLSLLTMRRDLPGTVGTIGIESVLVSMHNYSFILGPGLVCAFNTMTLAFVLRRSGLVARFIPLLGLVGGALLFVSATLQLFGVIDQVSKATVFATIPVFAWEISLASFLFFRGFKSKALSLLKVSTAERVDEELLTV